MSVPCHCPCSPQRLRREAAAATLAEQHQAQERARSAALRSQLSFTRRQSEPTGTQYDAFGVLIKPSPTIKPRYLDWLPSARAARAVAEAEASRPTPAPPHTFSPYSGIDPKPRGPVAWLLNAAPSAGVSTPAVLINPQNAVPRHASRPQSAKPLWRPSSAHAASPSSQKSVHGNRRPMSAMQGAGGSSSSNSGRQEVAVTGWQQQQQQRQQEVAAPGQRPSSAHLADMKSYTVTQIAMPCQVTTASQLGGMNASLTAGLPAPRFASSAHGAAHSNGAHQSNRAGLAQGQHYLSKGLVPPTETTGAQPAHGNTEQFTTHDRMTHRMADPVQAASPPSRPEGVTDAHYAQIARQQQKWLRESVAVPAVTWAAPAGLSAYGPRKRPQSALPAGSSSSVHHTTLTTTIHTSTTSGNDASSGNGLNRIMPHGRPLSAPSEGPSTNSSTTAGGHNSSSGANRMGTARPVSAMASTGRTSTGKGTYLTHTSSSGARAGTAAAGSVPWGAGSRPNSAAVKPPSRPVSACATSAWHHGTDSDGLHVASQHAAAIEVEMLQVPMQQLRSLTEEERNALLVSEQAGKGGGRKQVLAADSNALYQQMVSAYMMA